MVMLLAAVNCVCGAAVFVLASLAMPESWVPPLLTIVTSTLTTVGFAYWVSSLVLRPLDKLVLLAQSIERSPGMSVPDTTGSVETDDLLHTISRASRQLTNFLDMMDEVAAGNTKVALDPLEHSDRLSESFQKLVARVTGSIDAKIELDQLQKAVRHITKEIGCLKRGERVDLSSDFEQTRPIADALRQLIDWQDHAKQIVNSNASDLKTVVVDGKGRLDNVIEKNLGIERAVSEAIIAIGESSAEADALFREVSEVIGKSGPDVSAKPSMSVGAEEKARLQVSVRRQFDAALHKLRDVGEQVNSMKSVARAFLELAKRSNQAALAACMQEPDADEPRLDELTDEIAALSENAAGAHTVLAEIGDSVVRDMVEANASIQWVITEYDKIADRAVKAETRADGLSENFAALGDLRTRIDESITDAEAKTTRILKILATGAGGTQQVTDEVQTCKASLTMLNEPLEAMRELAGGSKNIVTLTSVSSSFVPPSSSNGNGRMELPSSAGDL